MVTETRTSSTLPELTQAMLRLGSGGHLCVIYEDAPTEQVPALVPFLQQGLRNGERVIYVADDATIDEVRGWLGSAEIDTAEELAHGALCLWTRAEWRQAGTLDSQLKAAQVRQMMAESDAAGFRGVRFGIEMTWTLGPDLDADSICHWESTINDILAGEDGRIVCQYSRKRLPPSTIRAALRSHPTAVIGNEVCPNPFYEGPILLSGDSEARRVDWMVAQLRKGRAAEREREQRIRAEAALEEMERTKDRIEQLLLAATQTAEELQQANAAKDEFLAVVSHELRTPITVILGNASILKARLPTLADTERRQAIDDIQDESARLNSIVNDLLTLAHLENGQGLETEPVLLGRLVDEVAQEYGRKHNRDVEIRATGSAVVEANRTCLGDVLGNLLSNADKYSPNASCIEIEVSSDTAECQVVVLDRGIGISEDDPAALFTAFFRADSVRHTMRGLGVGLAVCRRIIEAHDGRIWAEPREGGGSAFAFALPILAAE
jgi:signal transduction histidine kinase